MNRSEPQQGSGASGSPLLLVLFSALIALYCIWILLLPVFPSEDGPVHLFFTQVLGALLSHSSPTYQHFYTIQHILPPYSLYYYLLLGIAKVVPLLWADRIVVALAVAVLAFGLRYLLIAQSREGEVIAFLIFPVLLNWPLFMGFVNFTFSLGLAAWALGLWTHLERRPAARLRIAFFALLCIMTLTHPVPVGLVLVFCYGDLLFRLVESKLARSRASTSGHPLLSRAWKLDLLLLVLATLCCGAYVSAFTVRHIASQVVPPLSAAESVRWLLRGHGLVLYGGKELSTVIYRLSVVAAAVLALLLGLVHAWRNRSEGNGRLPRWLVFTALMVVALPFIPQDLNNSHLFRDRLVIVAWIAAFAAAAARSLSRRIRVGLVVYGTVTALMVLVILNREIRPIAQRVAKITQLPMNEHGRMALLLPADKDSFQEQLFFDPYQWAGVHYPRRAGEALLNTPWLDLPINTLGERQGLLTHSLPLLEVEAYTVLRQDLLAHAATRAKIFSQTDYVILVDRTRRTPTEPLDPVLAADTSAAWNCAAHDWFLVCDRHPH